MTRGLCVVTDRVPESVLRSSAPAAGQVDLLVFADAAPNVPALARWLGGKLQRQLDTRALLQEAVPCARERFVQFVAEWPDRVSVFGRPFREAFASGGCSLWWFTELAQKNPGARPTFGRLCQLEALKLALAQGDYERAVLICRDRDTARVLANACTARGLPVTTVGRLRAGGESFTRLMFGRVKRLALDLAATWSARRLPAGNRPVSGETRIVFHTWFPTQWRPWRGVLRDRYFVDLPDAVAARGKGRPFYACLLPAGSIRQIVDGVHVAARQLAELAPGSMIFIERFARLRDVFRLYFDFRSLVTYWWLERFDRRFRRSFDWDGVDVFPLLRHDLRMSFARDVPFFELLALRIAGMVRHLQPTDVITILETHGYGRAVSWGVRSSGVPARVVGYQHSAVNANQLVYRFRPSEVGDARSYVEHVPLPDEYLVHGEHARGMLVRSGITAERIFVCGSPRFDDLIEFRRERRERFDELRRGLGIAQADRMVLVATVIWPELTSRLIEWCGLALASRPGTTIVFKPHPLHKEIDAEIKAALSDAAGPVVVSHENLNRLQAAADVMIGTFGTSDIEAIAIGCPVIRVQTTDFDFSPSSDEPGATLDVGSAEELRTAVGRVLAGGYRADGADELIEKAFYKLDGRSLDRVIAALDRVDREPAAASA